jgi:hypothetical protein
MKYESLDQVDKPVLTTAECAHYLNRKPQTLRAWACLKSGPLTPINLFGRLGWRTEDVKRFLADGVSQNVSRAS